MLSEISSTPSQRSLSDEAYQQVINLLKIVKSSCCRSPVASAMFMEEMATAVRDGIIHSKVEVRTLLSACRWCSFQSLY